MSKTSKSVPSSTVSTDPETLLTPDGLCFTTGVASYYDCASPDSVFLEPRIHIPIGLGHSGPEFHAMVDTGAPWCILQPYLVERGNDEFEELSRDVSISTRLGRFDGRLVLGTVRLLADKGEALSIETTFFLSPQWPGGNFVGYVGFLDRLRFAVDPQSNLFYFGSL